MPKLLMRNATWFIVTNTAEFVAALANESVAAGDSIVMRAGTYTGDFVSTVGGSVGRPVRIMPYNNEDVKIDGSFYFQAPYVEIYDLEIFRSSTPKVNINDNAIKLYTAGSRLIGCNIHDLRNSVFFQGFGIGGIEECVIKNNGYYDDIDNPLSGHGYDIYTHNNWGGQRDIKRNLFYASVSQWSLHVYSPSNNMKDYKIEDNIFLQSASIGNYFTGTPNMTFKNNWLCGDRPGSYIELNIDRLLTVPCDNVSIESNSFWKTYYTLGYENITNLVEADNIVYIKVGTGYERAGYTETTNPATLVKITPFTKSKRWLGSVAIYNRDSASTVAVDFSSLLTGGDYLLRNGHNTDETFAFTYSGADVNVPMDTFTAAAEIGGFTPYDYFPITGAFMIERNP